MRANAVDIEVGRRLEAARILMDIDRRSLAARIGVSASELLAYERGERRIGATQLAELARALQVSPSFFFSRERVGGPHGDIFIPEFRTPDHDAD